MIDSRISMWRRKYDEVVAANKALQSRVALLDKMVITLNCIIILMVTAYVLQTINCSLR